MKAVNDEYQVTIERLIKWHNRAILSTNLNSHYIASEYWKKLNRIEQDNIIKKYPEYHIYNGT